MATLSKSGQIRRKHQPPTRCARGKKQQTKIGSVGTLADGFLGHQFLPLYEQGSELPDSEKAEKDFFESLQILSEHYSLKTIAFLDKSYPYNILLAKEQIQKQLKKTGQDIDLCIMQDNKGIIKLATQLHYCTGMTLYYIPVLPVYRLLQNKKQKQTAELLLSVFSYLYHIAQIPYYRESDTYLFYQYECMQEWLTDCFENDENEELSSISTECNKASYYGDILFRKLYNLYHLNHFKERMDNYKPSTTFEKKCWIVAKKAWELMNQYPEHNVFQNISNQDYDESEGLISARQYISFVAENEGVLFENISRVVNDEFNECSEIEEPRLLQIFDSQNQNLNDNLNFEYHFFPFLNDLCFLLNEIP